MYGAENLVSNYFLRNTFILLGLWCFIGGKGRQGKWLSLLTFGAFSRLEFAMHATCALAIATGWRVGLEGDVQRF
jgi:hypothetical protein